MKNSLLILSLIIFGLSLLLYFGGRPAPATASTYWGNKPELGSYWLSGGNTNVVFIQKAERFAGSITEVKEALDPNYYATITLANYNQQLVEVSVVDLPRSWDNNVLRRVEAANSGSPIVTALTPQEVEEAIKRKTSEEIFIRLSTTDINSRAYQLLESFLVYVR